MPLNNGDRLSWQIRWGSALLLLVGLFGMGADLIDIPPLRAAATATAASPTPRTFSTVRRAELFSAQVSLRWRNPDGQSVTTELSPARFSAVTGPARRRSLYMVVLRLGPILASTPRFRPMFEAISSATLCGDRPLLRELGIDPAQVTDPISINIQPKHQIPEGISLHLELPCG